MVITYFNKYDAKYKIKEINIQDKKQLEKVISQYFNNYTTVYDLWKDIAYAPSIELPTTTFNKNNLFNSNFFDLAEKEYENFFHLCSLYGYNGESREIFQKVIDGKNNLPVIMEGTNDIYYQLCGNMVMMAYRVLGIYPVVKLIKIDLEIKV